MKIGDKIGVVPLSTKLMFSGIRGRRKGGSNKLNVLLFSQASAHGPLPAEQNNAWAFIA